MGGAVAVVSLIVSAYSARQQQIAADRAEEFQEESLSEQRRQAKLQKRRADIKASRERIQLLRQQRRAVAESQTVSASTGGLTSSGSAGALASIRSQAASASSFMNAQQTLGDNIFQSGIRQSNLMSSANAAQAEGARWGSVGKVSGSIFGAAGGWQRIGSMFKDNSATGTSSSTSGYQGMSTSSFNWKQ